MLPTEILSTPVAATILASALDGIKNKLEPTKAIVGDRSKHSEQLPRFWEESLNIFNDSKFISDYLGFEFQKNFYRCKRQEKTEFDTRAFALEFDAYI